jgi:predicted ATP-grasp superfamily ATP-dependent carboligase
MGTIKTAELRDDNGFPIVIVPNVGLPNLADAAAKSTRGHLFGLNKDNAASALRMLADQIDADEVIPQEIIDATKATCGDFVFRTLTFTFAEKHKADA